MRNVFREGERICFRPLEMEDLEFLQRMIASEEIHPYIGVYWPLNKRAEREWLEGLYKTRENFPFGIALKEDDRLIGCCDLRLGAAAHRAAEIGIGIGEPEARGKGYGTEAIRLLLDYGFGTLNLHRIELRVYENNPRAIRCYEKCGFKREGIKREARWWDGRWWDSLDYAILAHEWREQAPSPGTAK
jgi:RimJ/RimL family protein N-acetyltransferase